MLNYYLCIFTNKNIDIRSYQNHRQKGVFFYKGCRDPAFSQVEKRLMKDDNEHFPDLRAKGISLKTASSTFCP